MANKAVTIVRPHGGKTIMKIDTVIQTTDITGVLDLGFRRMINLYAQGIGVWTGALSVALEYSLDSVNYYPLLDDAASPAAIVFTADNRFVSDRPVRYLRLVRSAGTAGADADFQIDVYSERNN